MISATLISTESKILSQQFQKSTMYTVAANMDMMFMATSAHRLPAQFSHGLDATLRLMHPLLIPQSSHSSDSFEFVFVYYAR